MLLWPEIFSSRARAPTASANFRAEAFSAARRVPFLRDRDAELARALRASVSSGDAVFCRVQRKIPMRGQHFQLARGARSLTDFAMEMSSDVPERTVLPIPKFSACVCGAGARRLRSRVAPPKSRAQPCTTASHTPRAHSHSFDETHAEAPGLSEAVNFVRANAQTRPTLAKRRRAAGNSVQFIPRG